MKIILQQKMNIRHQKQEQGTPTLQINNNQYTIRLLSKDCYRSLNGPGPWLARSEGASASNFSPPGTSLFVLMFFWLLLVSQGMIISRLISSLLYGLYKLMRTYRFKVGGNVMFGIFAFLSIVRLLFNNVD